MSRIHLKIITPESLVLEKEVDSVTCQTTEGEVTILPKHVPFLTLLSDGVVTVRAEGREEYFSSGSGYVETDGKTVRLLISHAYGQDELDERKIDEVKKEAEALLVKAESQADRQKAFAMLRRATFDLKILKKRRRKI